ncbi:MAG: S-ribosylhomocysteine lyase [Sodaliphilus sp.]|jgi:S-ribosylhomocysteine lyase|nr:S-ribosylhomocysteine lyase [Muribaculaceae bacterium]MCI6079849.1 S-ribosylhomocysteine lyase [Bacteroidales bacterium]MDY2592372.1 S-ribosylhomocysteine lyase [Sodaliphilus sp.]MCI6146156.1 S-ribosylhomocysteine lyase [Bacteroidales bacterium]MCI6224833.1 S-ribosylhomocysteine lyase [Bacteroidales bacterium]
MEKIASFTINHLKLLRGIYVSRVDTLPNGDVITTFDIRMKQPNREPAVSQSALHTIEHLAATYLRNQPEWKDKVIYWGPMGCCTGNYLLMSGKLTSKDILPLMQDTFRFIAEYEGSIPGATARDCGNYTLNNLPMAKWEARKYLIEVLENIKDENLEYPQD